MSVEHHRKGYRGYCRPPAIFIRWKLGQIWTCECGNAYKVVRGWDMRDWELIGAMGVEKRYTHRVDNSDIDLLVDRLKNLLSEHESSIEIGSYDLLLEGVEDTVREWVEE